MKLIIPTHHSRAIARIGDALERFAPRDAEIVRPETIRKDVHRTRPIQSEADGDVVVMLVNGLHDHFFYQAERCRQRGQKFAVIQIALRTTRQPKTSEWRDLWRDASVVWSYYPLDLWIKEDGDAPVDFNFLHAPLGVDPQIFTPDPKVDRDIVVLTSSARRNQESAAECDDATATIGGTLAQLGPQFSTRARAEFFSGLTDEELATLYRRCQFVSGLRRHEGFELPAAEGLFCGARPVLFDKPHYRDWYDGLAEFIPETNQQQITADLRQLFAKGAQPVSSRELEAGRLRFDWATVAKRFWEAAL